MKHFAVLTAAVAAAATLATPIYAHARPHAHHAHHARPLARWYHLTLAQKRVVVVKAIASERAPLRFWLHHRTRFPESAVAPYVFCGAVGIRTPAAVCRSSFRLVESIHVRKRIDAKLAAVAEAAARRALLPPWLVADFTCIHGYEGAWTSNTGNGYYGGMQMDVAFQRLYGPEFLARYGTADAWPIVDQLIASARAYRSGRGFGPWPNTARACGLL